jgi:hypothetical protein
MLAVAHPLDHPFTNFRKFALFVKVVRLGVLTVVDFETSLAESLDLRPRFFNQKDVVVRSVSDQPVPAIDIGIQIPKQSDWIEDESADADVAGKASNVPRSKLESHQAALRKTEKKCLIWRVARLFRRREDLGEQLSRSKNIGRWIFIQVEPAETRVVRVWSIDEQVIQLRDIQVVWKPSKILS